MKRVQLCSTATKDELNQHTNGKYTLVSYRSLFCQGLGRGQALAFRDELRLCLGLGLELWLFFSSAVCRTFLPHLRRLQPLKKTVILTHRESNYTPKATTHQTQLHTKGNYPPKAGSHHRQLHTRGNYTSKATTHQRQLHTTGTYTPKATSHHRQLHTVMSLGGGCISFALFGGAGRFIFGSWAFSFREKS